MKQLKWWFKLSSVAMVCFLCGCAAIRIDVDVYKGPLADEKDVQIQQLSSLVTVSRRLLENLQQQLLKNIALKGNRGEIINYIQFSVTEKSNYLGSDYIEININEPNSTDNEVQFAYGKANYNFCRNITGKQWLFKEGTDSGQDVDSDKAEKLTVQLNLACNLEFLLQLFDDLEQPPELKEFDLVLRQFMKKAREFNKNKNYSAFRQEVDKGVQKGLAFYSWLVNTQLPKLKAINNNPSALSQYQALRDTLAEVLAISINSGYFALALDINSGSLKEPLKSLKNMSPFNDYEKFCDVYENTKTAYQEADNKLTQWLVKEPELAQQIKDLVFTFKGLEQTDYNTLASKCITKPTNRSWSYIDFARIQSSGFARGVSLLYESKEGASSPELSFKELKSKVSNITQISNALSSDALNVGRGVNGLSTLLNKQFSNGIHGGHVEKEKEEEELLHLLVSYAGKLLGLADNQVLLNDSFNDVKDLKDYIDVLQSIGTAIVVQVNELERGKTHRENADIWRGFDWALLNSQVGDTPAAYQQRVLALLKQELSSVESKIAALGAAKTAFDSWNKTDQDTLTTLKDYIDKRQKYIAQIQLLLTKLNGLADKERPISKVIEQFENEKAIANHGKSCDNKTSVGCSELSAVVELLKGNESQKVKDVITQFTSTEAVLTKDKASMEAQAKPLQDKLEQLLSSHRAATKKPALGLDFDIDKLTRPFTDEQTAYNNTITAIGNLTLIGNTPNWIKLVVSKAEAGLKPKVQNIANQAVLYEASALFDCAESKDEKSKKVNTKPCNEKSALDALIKYLEAKAIKAKAEPLPNDSVVLGYERALTSAYDLRARRLPLIPPTAYLRSSYPVGSMQPDGSSGEWRNLLFSGEDLLYRIRELFGTPGDIKHLTDKRFWQNINTVRVKGVGDVNYVLAKDDIGNFYVKSYSAKPDRIFKSLSNAVVLNQAGKAGSFIGNNGGTLGLKNSSNAMDVMYGRYYEQYATGTKSQFDALKKWHSEKGWLNLVSGLCPETKDKDKDAFSAQALKTQVESLDSGLEGLSDGINATKEDDFEGQAKMIVKVLKTTSELAATLAAKFSGKNCSGKPLDKQADSALMAGFVTIQVKQRQSTVNDFEQKVLFISDALPPLQQPKLDIGGE